MKIKLSVPQVLARKVTHPRTDADEIYVAYFVTLAKTNTSGKVAEVRKYVAKKISKVHKGVKNGHKWKPDDLEAVIETGDADALFITMAVYEYDNGGIYKELLYTSDVLINPDDFDWATIDLPLDLTNWFTWVKSVWKLVVGLFNYLKQDDMLGEFSTALPLMKEALGTGWDGFREIKFKKYGGDYRVSLNIEVLED